MISSLSITVIVENRSMDPNLATEHGLALLLEADGQRILLDTGEQNLVGNAATLGIRLEQLDAVVLSHGHRDHSGGLAALLQLNPKVPVYLHPKATRSRYSLRGGKSHEIGLPPSCYDALAASDFRFCSSQHFLAEDIWLSGGINRGNYPQTLDPLLCLSANGDTPDPIEDDMALVIRSQHGLVVLCGCCHAGLAATLGQVAQQSPNDPIYAVVGGLHMRESSDADCQAQLKILDQYEVKKVLAGHCTGPQAETALQQHFGDDFAALWCGHRWCFLHSGLRPTVTSSPTH